MCRHKVKNYLSTNDEGKAPQAHNQCFLKFGNYMRQIVFAYAITSLEVFVIHMRHNETTNTTLKRDNVPQY